MGKGVHSEEQLEGKRKKIDKMKKGKKGREGDNIGRKGKILQKRTAGGSAHHEKHNKFVYERGVNQREPAKSDPWERGREGEQEGRKPTLFPVGKSLKQKGGSAIKSLEGPRKGSTSHENSKSIYAASLTCGDASVEESTKENSDDIAND